MVRSELDAELSLLEPPPFDLVFCGYGKFASYPLIVVDTGIAVLIYVQTFPPFGISEPFAGQ
jgi:hypothetical protein